MVGIGILGALAALAAPVVCDADLAARLLLEASIEEARAPVSHPELIPGLALASQRADPELQQVVRELCAAGDLSLRGAEEWRGPDWAAHTFLLTGGELVGCTLRERSVAISVGVRGGEAPRYRLRARLPEERTPVGDCASVPVYREETPIDGEDGPVRLVLLLDREGDDARHTSVAVRSADPSGWTEQILLDPAPLRLVTGGPGPVVELTDRFEEKWVVAHGDRAGSQGEAGCRALPDQRVWTPGPAGWVVHEGEDALRLLASRGLWRMAGNDGWFVIIAQDDEEDDFRVRSRTERLEAKSGKDLLTLPSGWFPDLNAGFYIAILGPYADREAAEAARRAWKPRAQAYVKRAWTAVDPCQVTTLGAPGSQAGNSTSLRSLPGRQSRTPFASEALP